MNPQPNRFFHLSLIFLVALNLVPHFNDYTVPTLAVGGLCLAWRLLYEYQIVPLPNLFTKVGLVFALFYLVYQNYGQILGLESGSALLICAVSLKLIDRVGYRDAMVLLFLNFMLLLSRFFVSQTLGITIFAAFDLIITTALLVQLHNGSRVKFNFFTLMKTGSKLFLQIAPFMILLFFVFPRFSTGFLQSNAKRTTLNGFGDSMQPGSMSQLAQSDQPAFRVRFLDKTPSPLDMYWRGGILVVNENMKWLSGSFEKSLLRTRPAPLKNPSEQEILLEPYFNDWLFTLDRGVWIEQRNIYLQRKTHSTEGDIFVLSKPVDKKFIYNAISVPEKNTELTAKQRRMYLQAPENNDPRVRELLDRISQGSVQSNEAKANRLMMFYQKQFRYTLTPGRLKSLDLGEFLFEKKVGFCEHFAVSFASLMRLAGVPSRVVVGFQGGRKNDLSDYYLVTSKDAHAWTEIYSDEKKQWLRFDPTIMVSPLRFELGGELYHSMTDEELAQVGDGSNFLANYKDGWLKQAYFAVDALATNWNMFLLNFDRSGQKDFFARMGFKNINQGLLLSVSLLILLSFFLWVRISNRRKTEKINPAQLTYLSLRAKLAKKGIEKEAFEGPSDFLTRAQQEWPEQNEPLEKFRELYLQSFYGLEDDHLSELKQTLKQIR